MDLFPDEVLLYIFSELSLSDLVSGVRLVSWRWYHLSKDASLWTDVDFTDIASSENKQEQSQIHQGMRNLLYSIQNSLQSLTFGTACHDGGVYELFGSVWKRKNRVVFPALKSLDYSFSYASPRNLRVAITTHPDIEELILCHTDISFSDAMKEAIHLPNLKVLMFQDSAWYDLNQDLHVVKLHVMKVPKMCTKLEVVELHTIQADLDDEVIQQFTKHCPNLKSLSLTCSSTLSPEAFTFINISTSQLTCLELRDRQMTGPYLYYVLPWFPHLTHLAVSGQYVHLEDCTAIANCCPNLQELVFQANISKSDRPQGLFDQFLNMNNANSMCGLELLTIVGKCKNLTKLHVPNSNIDDESVVYLTEQCPHLEDINFSECHRLTKVSLLALSKNSLKLRKLHFQDSLIGHEHLMNVLLKCRKLGEVFFDRKSKVEMVRIPSQDVQAKGLPRDPSNTSLSNIDDIPYIDMVTSDEDNDLRDMLLLGTPGAIENISPTYCSDVSLEYDLATKALHNHSPVKRLLLKHSIAKEKFLIAIVLECPSLTVLSLDGSDHLSDDLVTTIAKNCPYLKSLGLCLSVRQSSQFKFGDKGLLALINYSRKLECLSFLNNRNITSGAAQILFQALETTLPSLATVSLCVGRGFGCSSRVIALYGLKYLTEHSKKQLKSSASKNDSSFFIHLDFKRRKFCF